MHHNEIEKLIQNTLGPNHDPEFAKWLRRRLRRLVRMSIEMGGLIYHKRAKGGKGLELALKECKDVFGIKP